MITIDFRKGAPEKWRSLNPKYGRPEDGFVKALWHAVQAAWKGFFAPLYMGAWLLTGGRTEKTSTINDIPNVTAQWDTEANVWVASSDNVPGLVTEADTLVALEIKLKVLVLELFALNKLQLKSASFRLTATRDIALFVSEEPHYAPDDGPLTEKQITALRADVEKHFPRGKLISREDLFE